jgi:hypothetical protein
VGRTGFEPLGPIFHRLYNECHWIHAKWGQYFRDTLARIRLAMIGAVSAVERDWIVCRVRWQDVDSCNHVVILHGRMTSSWQSVDTDGF